ncbi:MAG: GrpB family protein [Pseudomonadota bacterium]
MLGLRRGTLAFAEPHPGWAKAFDVEATLIRTALSDLTLEIEHIGSTAVPGLMAKPILDIGMAADLSVFPIIAEVLGGLGYIDRGERSGRLFIRTRRGEVRTHNLHLYPTGSTEFEAQLLFRDALRGNADLRDRYTAEKLRIFEENGGRRAGYAEAKTEFIDAVLASLRGGSSPH